MAALSQYSHQFLVGGAPAANYLVDVFISGTSTRASIYRDAGLTVSHTNPIVLDINGQPPGNDLFIPNTGAYDIVLRTAGGAATGQEWIAVTPVPIPSATQFLPLTGGTMQGLFSLSGNAQSALQPVSLQQLTAAIAGITVTAAGVSVAAIPGVTGTNTQTVLAELAARGLPTQTGQSGKFLTTDGTNPSWGNVAGIVGTVASQSILFPNGLIVKWGVTGTVALDATNFQVDFPVVFPSSCAQVLISCATGLGSGSGSGERYSVSAHTWNASGFRIDNDSFAAQFAWLAIGS